jgi:hypothetical protein
MSMARAAQQLKRFAESDRFKQVAAEFRKFEERYARAVEWVKEEERRPAAQMVPPVPSQITQTAISPPPAKLQVEALLPSIESAPPLEQPPSEASLIGTVVRKPLPKTGRKCVELTKDWYLAGEIEDDISVEDLAKKLEDALAHDVGFPHISNHIKDWLGGWPPRNVFGPRQASGKMC